MFGVPDTGNGWFSQKLSYQEWFDFNIARRQYLNTLEVVTPAIAWLLIAGLYYPWTSFVFGCMFLVARTLYNIGYMKTPMARIPGQLLTMLMLLCLFIFAIVSIFKMVDDMSSAATFHTAVCQLSADGSGATNFGSIKFEQVEGENVQITGEIEGLVDGLHGFHVHTSSDFSNGCASTGGHYNPFGLNHGAPDAAERHVGDLGNVQVSGGKATVAMVDSQVQLYGETSVVGRACLVHAGQDDLGQGGDAGSLSTGNAGSRVACGKITLI